MKLYYWRDQKNFGDLLGQLLIKRFCKKDAIWSSAETSEIIMVGSILEHMPKNYSGVVAGCGKLLEGSKIDLTKAKILSLRGPLTAKGIPNVPVLGDPAMIADELVPIPEKKHDLGLIPHWSDQQLEHNPIFKKYNPRIIRVSDDPLKVITEIGECKKIVSSSLHGIILADAFHIPRRIEIAPAMLARPDIEGGLFKWMDYCASIGMQLTIGTTQEANYYNIVAKQHEVFDVFQEIKKIFR